MNDQKEYDYPNSKTDSNYTVTAPTGCDHNKNIQTPYDPAQRSRDFNETSNKPLSNSDTLNNNHSEACHDAKKTACSNQTTDSQCFTSHCSTDNYDQNNKCYTTNRDKKLDRQSIADNKRWHDALKQCPDSQNTISVLNSILKNVTMAYDCVNIVLQFVKNERFEQLLENQSDKYREFIMRCQTLAEDLNAELEPNGKLSQSWASLMIKMKLALNNSTTHIAEMMIQGTTMGIIDLGRLLRHTPDVLPKTLDLAREIMEFEEDKIEILKFYL